MQAHHESSLDPAAPRLQVWVFSTHADVNAMAGGHGSAGDRGLLVRFLRLHWSRVGALWVMHDDKMMDELKKSGLGVEAYRCRLRALVDTLGAIGLQVHSTEIRIGKLVSPESLTTAAQSLAESWFSPAALEERGRSLGLKPAFLLNGGVTLHNTLMAALAHLPDWQARLLFLGTANEVVELARLSADLCLAPRGEPSDAGSNAGD